MAQNHGAGSAEASPRLLALQARNLKIGFASGLSIVDGVDLELAAGELLCLVGESGSGKSLSALSIMGLLPPGAMVTADVLEIAGHDIRNASEERMQGIRGNRAAMIFQEPMTSLNPVMTIGRQLIEPLMRHRDLGQKEASKIAIDMLNRVQIPAAQERFTMYPHQLSGGMRQRVMIAMALVCRPDLLIADEPTTALDVTIQDQILRLIDELRREMGTAVLFITHNLSVVAQIADKVAVMYAGRIVESGTRNEVFADPQHPYTLSLFAAMPRSSDRGNRLAAIDGRVPSPGAMPPGCRFAPRCVFADQQCFESYPPVMTFGDTGRHRAACWNAPVEDSGQ